MKRSPLRKVSKKRSAQLRKYYELRKKFLEEHPYCQFPLGDRTYVCGFTPQHVHHKKLRAGEMLNNTRHWVVLCPRHHTWIHDHPNEARKKGLLT